MRFALTALLALISIALLWRQRHLHRQLNKTQHRLAGEYGMRACAEQTLHDTHARLCKVVVLQDDIMENERRRIARDIHDDLGQNLLALKIDIAMLQSNTGLPAQANRQLALIAGNLDLAIQSLRGIINDLRPIALQGGLRKAAESQLREFSRINGIPHELEAGQCPCDTGDSQIDTVIFRILQEALANIARHARASAVKIVLAREAGMLRMTVRDNGVGLPPGAWQRGCGLQGIADRIKGAGGQFELDSAPGRGTTLSLAIPQPEPAPERRWQCTGALGPPTTDTP